MNWRDYLNPIEAIQVAECDRTIGATAQAFALRRKIADRCMKRARGKTTPSGADTSGIGEKS